MKKTSFITRIISLGLTSAIITSLMVFPVPLQADSQNISYISHCASGLPRDIVVQGNYAYVACYDFLTVYDISDPNNPIQTALYDTPEETSGVALSGNFAYVVNSNINDSNAKLVKIDLTSDPANPTMINYPVDQGCPRKIKIIDNTAYIADYTGLTVFDIASSVSHRYDTPGSAYDVDVIGDLAFVADYISGLTVIDLTSDPANPDMKTYDISDDISSHRVTAIDVVGTIAYIANYDGDLAVVDISNITTDFFPDTVGFQTYTLVGRAVGVHVVGDYAYVA
ncbi:MAG: hypothetical protein ABII23_02190, partial [bacterium]